MHIMYPLYLAILPIEIMGTLCYNLITERERKIPNTRKEKIMYIEWKINWTIDSIETLESKGYKPCTEEDVYIADAKPYDDFWED